MITKDLHDGRRRACHIKVTPALREDMQELLALTYTLEEFKSAIKHLSKDKAPGLSKVNSNMIKAWDSGTIARRFSSGGKTISCSLSQRFLGTPTKNMHPISLFEIIEKI
jgi:hypothetical protein